MNDETTNPADNLDAEGGPTDEVPTREDSTSTDEAKGACTQSLRPAYIFHLPRWLYEHPAYRSLNAAERRALDVIGWKCDDPKNHPGARGNLLGCFCRDELADFIGCSRRSLTSYIDKFEQIGFVRTLTRGGLIKGSTLANVVGIPAAPGDLDAIAAPKGAKPTKYVREFIHKKLSLVGNGCGLSDRPPLVGKSCTDPMQDLQSVNASSATTQRDGCVLPKPLDQSPEPKPITSSPGPAVARDVEDDAPPSVDPDLRRVLYEIGVRGTNLNRLSKRTDVTAKAVLLLIASDAAQGVCNLPGFVVDRLDGFDGANTDELLVDDEEAPKWRLIRAGVLKYHEGRLRVSQEKLKAVDLGDLPAQDGSYTELNLAYEALHIDYHEPETCDMTNRGDPIAAFRSAMAVCMYAIYGGDSSDYYPLLARAPAFKIRPYLDAAQKIDHPSPAKYAMEKMGVAA